MSEPCEWHCRGHSKGFLPCRLAHGWWVTLMGRTFNLIHLQPVSGWIWLLLKITLHQSSFWCWFFPGVKEGITECWCSRRLRRCSKGLPQEDKWCEWRLARGVARGLSRAWGISSLWLVFWLMEKLWALFCAFVVWYRICAARQLFFWAAPFLSDSSCLVAVGAGSRHPARKAAALGGKCKRGSLSLPRPYGCEHRHWERRMPWWERAAWSPLRCWFRRAPNWDVWSSSNLPEKLFLFKD